MASLINHVHGKFKKVCVCGVVVKKAFSLMLNIFVPWLIYVRLALGIFINIIFVVTGFIYIYIYNAVILHS